MPDNSAYYYAAYAAGTIIFVVYAAALSWRRKSLRHREPDLRN
ncbi:MAG: hypothetical protein WKF55_05800 [Gemmatimonadaceae bacterium]